MTARYIADVETDGFLEELTVIHCLHIRNIDTGEHLDYADQPGYAPILEGLEVLAKADVIAGHNWISFDDLAIRKVYPEWDTAAKIEDTLVWAKIVCPKDALKSGDFARFRRGKLPGSLIGRYSLEAFGHRLGNYKGDYDGGWDAWSKEMHDYCAQDVEVNYNLYQYFEKKGRPQPAFDIEHQVQTIITRQESYGFKFDTAKAQELEAVLVGRKQLLEAELRQEFGSLYMKEGGSKGSTVTPQGKYAVRKGWVVAEEAEVVFKTRKEAVLHGADPIKGTRTVWSEPPAMDAGGVKFERSHNGTYTKVKLCQFNPGSRDHITHWLEVKRGWRPEKTADKSGKAQLDDAVLRSLPWPEAAKIGEYLMIKKRLGQLSTGAKAWLRYVGADGRMHGRHNTMGAASARMTHNNPNMAQVPGLTDRNSGGAMPYGRECRELFTVGEGRVLVGCDADALELRCLAARMAKYDGGAYVETVTKGNKADGTDMHTVNMNALGFTDRGRAKTWFYAFIYGSGNENLGRVAGVSGEAKPGAHGMVDHKARNRGAKDRRNFLEALPSLKQLIDAVENVCDDRGSIKALDGRTIPIRSKHAALNMLLQSDGAILMKQALCLLDAGLQEAGLKPGADYDFVANVHDEWQIEVLEEHAKFVGEAAAKSIKFAGLVLDYACPLEANYETGNTWADTH